MGNKSTLAEVRKKSLEAVLPERTVLPSGMVILTKKMLSNGFASMVLGTKRGGSFFGPPELFHFLEHLLSVPYRTRSYVDDVDAGTTINSVVVAKTTIAQRKLIKKLRDIAHDINRPAFTALESERGAIITELGERFDDPDLFITNLFLEACFPKSNIARSNSEEFSSIRHHLTKSMLLKYARKFFVPSNLILAITGDSVLHSKICDEAQRLFTSDKPAPKFRRPPLGKPTGTVDNPQIVVRPGIKNSYFELGMPLRNFPMDQGLAFTLLGNLLENHLNHILRFRYGLVYGVKFQLVHNYLFSFWGLSGSCEPKNLRRVVELVCRELESFSVSEREVDSQKEFSFEMAVNFCSNPGRCADFMYDLELDGVDYPKTTEVLLRTNADSLRSLWRKHFSVDCVAMVILRSKP